MANLTTEIVRRLFPEVRESWGKNGKEFNVHCPFGHKKGGLYKLYINASTGTYYCQDCKSKGSAWEKFFESIISSRYGHLRLLRDRDVVPMDSPGRFFARDGSGIRWGERNPILAPGQTVELADLSDQHPAFQYLLQRGLDPGEFANPDHPFRGLYCTKGQVEVLSGRCKVEARIIFPVYSGGEPVGWTARLIDRIEHGENGEVRRFVWDGRDWNQTLRLENGKWSDFEIPKWFHLPSMAKSSILYNLDHASSYDVGVIVEGPFDVHKVGPFAAGYFGEVPSRHQRRLIMNNWSEVVWIPDSGVDMEKEGVQVCLAELREACTVHVFKLDGFDDPGDAPREQIWNQIRERINQASE